jgi:quercetin dioxygenase-like cupin family protein
MSGDQANGASMVVLSVAGTTKAAADRFTDDVLVDSITVGVGPACARLATVRYLPAACMAWHRHTQGQAVHVTSGRRLVQTRDGHAILMRPGDTASTQPRVWHWHGAAPDAFMTHLADSSTDFPVADVEWGDLVSDDHDATARTQLTTDRATS